MRSVPNWANPILRNASYNIVAPGTPLVPNSTYYITLQALAPIPLNADGSNALNIIYLQSADGLTPRLRSQSTGHGDQPEFHSDVSRYYSRGG